MMSRQDSECETHQTKKGGPSRLFHSPFTFDHRPSTTDHRPPTTDHFIPCRRLYLKNNPKSVFASSGQAADAVTKSFTDHEKIRSQIKPVTHEWKKSVDMNLGGVRIRFLGLHHSGERSKDIQNVGHMIEIEGKKPLHIGHVA